MKQILLLLFFFAASLFVKAQEIFLREVPNFLKTKNSLVSFANDDSLIDINHFRAMAYYTSVCFDGTYYISYGGQESTRSEESIGIQNPDGGFSFTETKKGGDVSLSYENYYDLNGDGVSELLSTEYYIGNTSIGGKYLHDFGLERIFFYDANYDGLFDLCRVDSMGLHFLLQLDNNGTSENVFAPFDTLGLSFACDSCACAFGDITNDDVDELVVFNKGLVTYYPITLGSFVGFGAVDTIKLQPEAPNDGYGVLADFDNNGLLDLSVQYGFDNYVYADSFRYRKLYQIDFKDEVNSFPPVVGHDTIYVPSHVRRYLSPSDLSISDGDLDDDVLMLHFTKVTGSNYDMFVDEGDSLASNLIGNVSGYSTVVGQNIILKYVLSDGELQSLDTGTITLIITPYQYPTSADTLIYLFGQRRIRLRDLPIQYGDVYGNTVYEPLNDILLVTMLTGGTFYNKYGFLIQPSFLPQTLDMDDFYQAPAYSGQQDTVSFMFSVNDGNKYSDLYSMQVVVLGPNTGPVGGDTTLTVPMHTNFTFKLDGMPYTDAEGDSITGYWVHPPLNGVLKRGGITVTSPTFITQNTVLTYRLDDFSPNEIYMMPFFFSDGVTADQSISKVYFNILPNAPLVFNGIAKEQKVGLPLLMSDFLQMAIYDTDGYTFDSIEVMAAPLYGIIKFGVDTITSFPFKCNSTGSLLYIGFQDSIYDDLSIRLHDTYTGWSNFNMFSIFGIFHSSLSNAAPIATNKHYLRYWSQEKNYSLSSIGYFDPDNSNIQFFRIVSHTFPSNKLSYLNEAVTTDQVITLNTGSAFRLDTFYIGGSEEVFDTLFYNVTDFSGAVSDTGYMVVRTIGDSPPIAVNDTLESNYAVLYLNTYDKFKYSDVESINKIFLDSVSGPGNIMIENDTLDLPYSATASFFNAQGIYFEPDSQNMDMVLSKIYYRVATGGNQLMSNAAVLTFRFYDNTYYYCFPNDTEINVSPMGEYLFSSEDFECINNGNWSHIYFKTLPTSGVLTILGGGSVQPFNMFTKSAINTLRYTASTVFSGLDTAIFNLVYSNGVIEEATLRINILTNTDELKRSAIKLYPNPIDDEQYLVIESNDDLLNMNKVKIVCYNLLGQEIHLPKPELSDEKAKFDIRTLPTGSYYFHVSEDSETVFLSFIKI